MPKAELKTKELRELEGDLANAMQEGFMEPKSISDFEWCARAVIERFIIEKRKSRIDLYTGEPLNFKEED